MTTLGSLHLGELLVGLAVAGEALALTAGMHLLSPRPNAWISVRNDLLLAVDVVTGAGLVWFAILDGANAQTSLLRVCLAAALLAHSYREWEWFANSDQRFCINGPLVAFNTLKLAGLLGLLALGFL
jgi:hypothetical protein